MSKRKDNQVKINLDLNKKINSKENNDADLDTIYFNNIKKISLTGQQFTLNNEELKSDIDSNKFGDDDLDARATKISKEQMLHEKKFIFWVKIISMTVCSFVFILIFIAYFLNLILPCDKKWLFESDLSKIESISVAIASGIATSIITNYFLTTKK